LREFQITIEVNVNATELNVHSAAPHLPIQQMTQHHQFVCDCKDVCRSGQICNGLDDIGLIKKFVRLWESGLTDENPESSPAPKGARYSCTAV
jgi:hypothetical protein